MQKEIIKISIYEDNRALRDSLSKLIEAFPDFELAGAFPNAVAVVKNTKQNKPHVVLMDIDMPGISGIEAVELLHKEFPEVKVIMQTVFEEEEKIFRSLCAGALGYILKKTAPMQILEAIKDVYSGGAPMSPLIATKVLKMFRNQAPKNISENNFQNTEEINLTEREKEILTHLTNGLSYKMIAAQCSVSIDTVRFHIKKIYEKLHVHSMTEAVAKALRDKLV